MMQRYLGGDYMVRFVGLGDNVCDVYLHKNMMFPGGQALNSAVYAKELGAESAFLGVFGSDAFAGHVTGVLSARKVDFSRCRRYDGENGFAVVTIENGDRVFKGSNRGGVIQQHPIVLSADDMNYLSGADVIHLSNNGFCDSELPALHALGPLISYDFSQSWRQEGKLGSVCPYIDFAFMSAGDASEEKAKELCRDSVDFGCGTAVVTRGGEGAVAYDGTEFFLQPPKLVEPVDTLGAGDSFTACLLVEIAKRLSADGRASWLRGEYRRRALSEALADAAVFSSGTCLVSGAFGDGVEIPDSVRPSIERILNRK